MTKIMNRLRGDRVIVDLEGVRKERKEAYKEVGGILVPDDTPAEALLVKGTVVRVGHQIHPQDLKEGQTVYVKKMQGEKMYSDEELYVFRELHVFGND